MYFLLIIENGNNQIKEFDLFGQLVTVNTLSEEIFYGYEIKCSTNISIGSNTKISLTGDNLSIATDYAGRNLIFYYEKNDIFLCSDSLKLLSEELQNKKIKLEPNIDIIEIEIIDEWLTQQITSEKTFVKDIYVLPAGYNITYNTKNNQFSINLKAELYQINNLTYEELLHKGCQILAEEISAIQNKFGIVLLSLSGGRDSRALFAACRYLFKENFNKYVYVQSSETNIDDFLIAKKMTDFYKYEINSELPIKRKWKCISPELAINRYLNANLGTYYMNTIDRSYYEDFNIASIRGGQAQGGYNLDKTFIEYISKKHGISIAKIRTHFYGSIINDFDENTDFFDKHYLKWRYRIHYGRIYSGISQWSITFDPLINPFLDAANFKISSDSRYKGRLSGDLILAFDKELLNFEFDSTHKKINEEIIKSSVYYKNKIELDTLKETEIKMHYLSKEINSIYLGQEEFELKCNDILLEKIQNSKILNELCKLSNNTSFVNSLVKSNFNKDIINNNKHKLSKLAQFAELF